MFAYRERRLRAPGLAGVARVKFPTAGNFEFKADLAMNAVVGFATVPPAPLLARMRSKLMPVSTSTPGCTAGTLPRKGISDRPTARARAEGKPGHDTPVVTRTEQGPYLCGRAVGPRYGHPGCTVLECAPSEPRPFQ